MGKYFVSLFICVFFSFNSWSDERKNTNGTISNITPVISTDFSGLKNQKVYYAGGYSGRRYEQVDFLKPVPGNEFEKCNIEIGTELTLLGQEYFFEGIPILLAQVSDPNLQGKGYSRLCGFQSHIFVQKESLSLTRPIYTPYNYFDDYTSFAARGGFYKGVIVYLNIKAYPSSWAPIKNVDHWFHPERDIAYINHCSVLPEPRLQIHGFSEDKNFVLLEVMDDEWPEAACQKGHQIVLPIADIDRSHSKEDICDEIYWYSDSERTCHIHSFSSVRLLEEIDSIFKWRGEMNLNKLMNRSLSGPLQMYVGIGIDPLVRYAQRYTAEQAKKVLAWLVWPSSSLTNSPNEEALIAVNAIFNADIGHWKRTAYLLQELLERGLRFPAKGYRTPDDLVKAFNQVIYEGKDITGGETRSYTFLDLIQKSQNKEAWQWVHFFIEEGLCELADEDDGGLRAPCESEQDCPEDKACMLQTYCALSETMSDEAAQSLAEFDYFKEFIDDVIYAEVNKSHWSRPDLQSSESLVWHKDLCGGLTQ